MDWIATAGGRPWPVQMTQHPNNGRAATGKALYGRFTMHNSWPRKTGEARDLFIDKFSGSTLAEQNVYGNGTITRGMDTLVSTHMGAQLGLFTRIVMTLLCLLAIWSVINAFSGVAADPARSASVLAETLWS